MLTLATQVAGVSFPTQTEILSGCGSVVIHSAERKVRIHLPPADESANFWFLSINTTLATKASHCSRTLPLMPQLVQTLKSLSSLTLLAASRLCTMRSNFSGLSLSG